MALRSSLPRIKPVARERRAAGDSFTVDTATATLVRDISRRAAWTLLLDGVESSHVDLDDPTLLEFEYVRWLGDIIDCLAPAGAPVDTVHVGGGAMTLARYVMATRPASEQVVLELDGALVELVRDRLPWARGRKSRRLRVRVGDASRAITGLAEASWDVVVRDAFLDAEVPPSLRTVENVGRVKKGLRPSGVYLRNVTDRAPFSVTGVELATLLEVFTEVAVISEPSVLRGRRHGNLIIAAADQPLPLEAIARRIADGGVQGRVRDHGQATQLARGHRPFREVQASGDSGQ